MATAFAAQKPPLGQKMPQAWSRPENRPLSRRMHREKCRPLVRLASGAPVFANGAATAAMGYAFNSLAHELSRGLKVQSTLKQVEDLSREDLEILFERSFSEDDALIFKTNLDVQLRADFFADTSSLREAAMNIVEAEYKSAGFGPARGLTRNAIIRVISTRLNIPESYIKQTLRAERVIQEVDSIEPTLKGVVEGIRQGNQEVLRVWNDY